MNIALLFGTFLILMALGLPIALTMGASAALYIVCCTNISPLIIMQQTVSGVNNYVLLAAPFFIMAGALMESGGISKRLVRFCMSLVGHCTGGLGNGRRSSLRVFCGNVRIGNCYDCCCRRNHDSLHVQ